MIPGTILFVVISRFSSGSARTAVISALSRFANANVDRPSPLIEPLQAVGDVEFLAAGQGWGTEKVEECDVRSRDLIGRGLKEIAQQIMLSSSVVEALIHGRPAT
jgi:hypothetical protein